MRKVVVSLGFCPVSESRGPAPMWVRAILRDLVPNTSCMPGGCRALPGQS